MENKSYAFRAGLFTLGLGLALCLIVVWFQRDASESVPIVLTSQHSVAGLSEQSAVRYRGLEVGKVESIAFDTRQAGRIVVRAGIAPGTPLTTSTFATLGYQGVTGLAFIQLDDSGASTQRVQTSAAQPFHVEIRPGLFDRLAERGDRVLRQVEQATERFNALLAPANQQALTAMFTNVSEASRKLSAASAQFVTLRTQLAPTLEALPGLTKDLRATMRTSQTTIQQIGQAAGGIESLSVRLSEPGGAMDQLARGVSEIGWAASRMTGDTLPRIDALADEVQRTARAVTQASETFRTQPQSLIFGTAPRLPGPGERGFIAPVSPSTPTP